MTLAVDPTHGQPDSAQASSANPDPGRDRRSAAASRDTLAAARDQIAELRGQLGEVQCPR